jgi:hypothetical protein
MHQLCVVTTLPVFERVCADPELISTGQEVDRSISAMLAEAALPSERLSGEVRQGGAL